MRLRGVLYSFGGVTDIQEVLPLARIESSQRPLIGQTRVMKIHTITAVQVEFLQMICVHYRY